MTWFTSFFNPVQCEEAHQPESAVAATHAEDKHEAEETPKTEDKEEEEEAPAEEEEEEEPEDALPAIREECKASKNCVQLTKHFEHCEEKVNAGKGFKGEDCVEELFHLMHCVDACVAPKIFSKLK